MQNIRHYYGLFRVWNFSSHLRLRRSMCVGLSQDPEGRNMGSLSKLLTHISSGYAATKRASHASQTTVTLVRAAALESTHRFKKVSSPV